MAQRRVRDFYPTPEYATREFLRRYLVTGRVVEPCAGEGHMSNELVRAGLAVITNDIDPRFACDMVEDASLPAFWARIGPFDWAVSNPPFEKALAISQLALRSARRGVAMILRVTFCEPTETGTPEKHCKDGRILAPTRPRAPFLEAFPPTGFHPLPRMSFTGDGKTDSATCAWFVWEKALLGKVRAVDVIREPGSADRAPAHVNGVDGQVPGLNPAPLAGVLSTTV